MFIRLLYKDTFHHTVFLWSSLQEYYGFDGNCYNWFNSYISEKLMFVKINNNASDWLLVSTAVPQGNPLHITFLFFAMYCSPFNRKSYLLMINCLSFLQTL